MTTLSETSARKRFSLPELSTPLNVFVDILIVVAVSGAVFFLEDLAYSLGWIPYGTEIRGAFSVVAGAATAVVLVISRGGSLADLGFRRPTRLALVPFQATAILLAFLLGQSLGPLLVSLFVELPAPDFSRYDSIQGNLLAAIGMALILPLTASIPEEIIYRGFLMGRLTSLFGDDRRGAILTVMVQALIFGAIHFQWGLGGMIFTAIMGVVWGTAFLLCGRNLWIVIIAHSLGHLLFVTQLYLGISLVG